MSGIWPGDIQCVAMLSFDVDGVSSWLRRNPDFARMPSLMSMAEYGPSVAAPRILDILDAHDIKATFFVPGYVAETHQDLVEDICARGHEVAHHGYLHEAPASMNAEEEEEVLRKGIDILRGLTGHRPVGYRSPSWELSEASLDLLSRYEFAYDSSLMGDDAPYMLDSGEGGLVEIPVSWVLDDAPHFVHAPSAQRTSPMKSPDEVMDIWLAEFEGLYRYGRAFPLTMHPQYIGRPGRLLMLEKLIARISAFPNVSFMRMIDVADMWRQKQASMRGSQANMSDGELKRMSMLLKERNAVDGEVASVIGRPAERGHIGEYVASRIFDIDLHDSAVHKGSDGTFRTGPLAGRSVNVKCYGKQEGILDLKADLTVDYYLVLTGPRATQVNSRGATRPWTISSVYLFDVKNLLTQVTGKINEATSVRKHLWEAAEIYPSQTNPALVLSPAQRDAIELFADHGS